MTLAELYTVLDTAFQGKVCYNAFPEKSVPLMPYICIVETNTQNFGADNKVYFKRKMADVELYTKTKDLTTESTLENALDNAGIFYNATDTYLDDERCFERIYEIEV